MSNPSSDDSGGPIDSARKIVDETVSGAKEVADDADDTVSKAQETLDDAGNAVDSRIEQAQDAAVDVGHVLEGHRGDRFEGVQTKAEDSSGVSGATAKIADAGLDLASSKARAERQAWGEVGQGDVGGTADEIKEGTGENAPHLARASDAALGSTDEYVMRAEVDRNVTDDLTRGGILSETRDDSSGIVPGEVAGIGLSEAGFRRSARKVDEYKETFDEGKPFLNSPKAESVVQGAAGAGVDILNVPSHVTMAETATEVAQGTPGAIMEHTGELAETSTAVGRTAVSSMGRQAASKPIETVSGLGMEYLTGVGIAKAASKGAKAAGRLKKTKVDPEDVTNPDTLDYYEGRDADPSDRFPGFRPGDYPEAEGDLPETFRRQGEDFTPPELQDELGPTSSTETYATHGTTYDFDAEFEAGVPKGRPSDPDDAMFVGPEFSPGFAGLDQSSSTISSLRPRLPRASDFRGSDKQMVVSKMDVDEVPGDVGPEAPTGDSPMAPGAESQWLADEATEGRAYVRNRRNRNLGEAEAIVPGGSRFRELSESGDYYTTIGGETVDIRLFESLDDTPSPDPDAGDLGAADGPVDETGGLYSVSELPSSGRTSPEGTPVAPTVGLGYGADRVDPAGIDETGLSEPDSPSRTSSRSSDEGRSQPTGSDSSDRSPVQPSSSGPMPIDETGLTSGPSAASAPSGSPAPSGQSTGPSGVSSPPVSPPASTGSSIPWSGPISAASGSSPFGSPSAPPTEPTRRRRRRDDDDEDEKRDDEMFPVVPYDIPFSNPIASGAQVLFGGFEP